MLKRMAEESEAASNDLASARAEAVQVAAMALRYLADVPGTKEYTK